MYVLLKHIDAEIIVDLMTVHRNKGMVCESLFCPLSANLRE
jgi:hypothetical protein